MTHTLRLFWTAILCLSAACADADEASEGAAPTPSERPQGFQGGKADGLFDPLDMGRHYPLQVQHPESGVYDPAEHAFYVGSLEDGGVWRVDARDGQASPLYKEQRAGQWWTMGMDLDPGRRLLWVCSMEDLRGTDRKKIENLGFILKLDLRDGSLLGRFDLSEVATEAKCADVAVAADGSAYVVDRSNPNIYRIDPQDRLTLFASDPKLEASVVGQNAVVVLPDQSALLSITYMRPKLLRTDLRTGEVSRVKIKGDFFDHFPLLSGADGMTLSGGELLVMFSSELMRLTPDGADWGRARSRSVDVPRGHTDIIHTPQGDYMLNGQALRFAFGRQAEPFALTLAPKAR